MVFVQKWPFFPIFFLRQYSPGKMFFYDILQQENLFLGYKNKTIENSKNWHLSKGEIPWFWSKNGHFSNFFLGNIGQENVFYDILERKKAFVGYKKKEVEKVKKLNLSKGVDLWFSSKNSHFSKFFLEAILARQNVFLRFSTTKKLFSRI